MVSSECQPLAGASPGLWQPYTLWFRESGWLSCDHEAALLFWQILSGTSLLLRWFCFFGMSILQRLECLDLNRNGFGKVFIVLLVWV